MQRFAVNEYPFDIIDTGVFRDSPVARVFATGDAIRRRLADTDCSIDFPMLHDLRIEGVTDYLASPLVFTDGEIQLATWTTRQPGGFTDSQMAGLGSIIAPLARVAQIHALRRTAGNLLNTYVGPHAGNASWPAKFDAVIPRRFTLRSGSRTCVGSQRWPIVCRRRH
jgi:adenylate cyclase